MMLSAEEYYEKHLINLDIDGLLEVIETLQKDMSLTKDHLENPDNENDIVLEESHLEQVNMSRKYIQRAIKALEDLGYQYTFSNEEQGARDFNHKLNELSRIEFEIASDPVMMDQVIISFKDEMAKIELSHPDKKELEADLGLGLIMIPKAELLSQLKEMYLGEWEEVYKNPDLSSGSQWKLALTFEDGEEVSFTGNNLYPYNFSTLLNILGFTE